MVDIQLILFLRIVLFLRLVLRLKGRLPEDLDDRRSPVDRRLLSVFLKGVPQDLQPALHKGLVKIVRPIILVVIVKLPVGRSGIASTLPFPRPAKEVTASREITTESPISANCFTASRTTLSNPMGTRSLTVFFFVMSLRVTANPIRYPSVKVRAMAAIFSSGSLAENPPSEAHSPR